MSNRLLFVLCTGAVLGAAVSAAAAGPADAEARLAARAQAIQEVVDGLRAQLAIPDAVFVSIGKNDLVASVGRTTDRPDTFTLVFDDSFLDELDAEELDAAIAHELGHVWIFTHHPYLQTEELANKVALRLVTRTSLERLYEKVWLRGGKGDLQYLPASHTAPVSGGRKR
jgi:hypothetical protein